MKIWLDDLRDPKDFGQEEALWAKSARGLFMMGISLSSKNLLEEVEEISFDNDLGEGVLEGYYCFTRIEAMLHAGSLKGLKRIYVHSSNPAAVAKFMLAKDSFKSHFNIDIIRRPL